MEIRISYYNELSLDRAAGQYWLTLDNELDREFHKRCDRAGRFWKGFLDVDLFSFSDLVYLNFSQKQIDLMLSMEHCDMEFFTLEPIFINRFMEEFWRIWELRTRKYAVAP